MRRWCIHWLCISLCCSSAGASEWTSIETAFRNATATREDRLIAQVAELKARLNERLSKPEVTYGWVNRTRQVFAGNVKQCVNGVCSIVSTYRTETYPSWEPVASSQHVVGVLDAPEAAPTPMADVVRVLAILNPKKHETFVDFGCGADARLVIDAVRRFGCKGLGFEIDAKRAAAAQRAVDASGLGSRIRIVHGDAASYVIEADVGYAYLFPDDLKKLAKQFHKLKRFVSRMHAVEGMEMRDYGQGLYVWVRPVAAVQRLTYPVAMWGGYQYTGRVCSNPRCTMCASIQRQLGR